MQDRLVITGIPPFDGEHDFDLVDMLGSLTNRELHRIKVISGVRAGELFESLKAGDSDLVVAFACILLGRKGKRVDEDALWDAPAGSGITLEIGDRDQEDEGPPVVAATTPPTSGGGSGPKPSEPHQGNDQSSTGHPDSETHISDQVSPPLRSVI